MEDESLQLKFANWHWPKSGLLFTIASGIISIIVVIFVNAFSEWLLAIRIAVVVGAFILPLFVAFMVQSSARLIVSIRRAHNYPITLQKLAEARNATEKHKQLITRLLGERRRWLMFAISGAYVFEDRPLIHIEKKRGTTIGTADTFSVVDENSGQHYGTFTYLESRREHYVAESNGDIDPLWHGYLRENPGTEMPVPPGMCAVLHRDLITDEQ